jgi:hypothetical protein
MFAITVRTAARSSAAPQFLPRMNCFQQNDRFRKLILGKFLTESVSIGIAYTIFIQSAQYRSPNASSTVND